MSNEVEDLSSQVKLGEQAKELLSNKMLSGWFIARKADLFESFGMTSAGDDEARRLIWLKKQVVDEIERDLHNYVQSGNLAMSTLKEWDQLKKGEQ